MKGLNANITGGGDGGYPRLTRGVDGAEFTPLPEEAAKTCNLAGFV